MNFWVWQPNLTALDDLHRQMNRLVDWTLNVVSQQFNQTWQPLPSCNVYETASDYQFLFPLPGLKPENVDVQVSGMQLTIKGERKRPQEIGDDQYRRQERWMGRWSRTLQLPERADPNQIHASVEHGLLVVQVAKLPEQQPKQVTVKVGAKHAPSAGQAIEILTDGREHEH